MDGLLEIKASGMVTSIGFNARASCAAIRGGVSGVKTGKLWDSESGEYIQVGKVPLPQWWEGFGKLVELVAPAINECLIAAKPVEAKDIPLLLAVSSSESPCHFGELETSLIDELEHKLNVGHHPESRVISDGSVSGVVTLNLVQELFKNRKISCCIVAGTESFLHQGVVNAYMAQQRVLTPGNSDGFIPGEAGCAVLIKKAQRDKGTGLRIIGIGFGVEAGSVESDLPTTGDGLTKAIRAALTQANLKFSDVDYWLNDQNGEAYKFKEATIAKIRLERERETPRHRRFEVWHPIEFLGEIGSAIVPCLLGLALGAHSFGYAPGHLALLHVGSDNGKRAALILEWKREGNY